jgi:hypothetical protein
LRHFTLWLWLSALDGSGAGFSRTCWSAAFDGSSAGFRGARWLAALCGCGVVLLHHHCVVMLCCGSGVLRGWGVALHHVVVFCCRSVMLLGCGCVRVLRHGGALLRGVLLLLPDCGGRLGDGVGNGVRGYGLGWSTVVGGEELLLVLRGGLCYLALLS